VAEEVCAPGAHRQVVLTIPKRLRLHTRFDRRLLGQLCVCAWTCTQRNFQILDPLEFLAEFTQHIPPKGAHLIRYYGWYSNKARGMRRKAAEAAATAEQLTAASAVDAASVPVRSRASQTWAMLIKRVYEVDPLVCAKCGGTMKVVAFIEPPQADVIEKILRGHRRAAMVGGLWCASSPRAPPARDLRVYDPDGQADRQPAASDEFRELTFVDLDTFEATF
jgi:hypothetical protein